MAKKKRSGNDAKQPPRSAGTAGRAEPETERAPSRLPTDAPPAKVAAKPAEQQAAEKPAEQKVAAQEVAEEQAPDEVAEERAPDEVDKEGFLLVGVGASAGGLEALSDLFHHIEHDAMAFIVVQHLAPDHESILAQLLGRITRVPVVPAVDGVTVEPNHIYVIQPDVDLAVRHGVIRLLAATGRSGPRLPIDYLFRSIAEDHGRHAVGIVLSGTGTDGTLGLEAIKAAGGYTFAQDPATAKYDSMPRNAISSGTVDYTLSPKGIAAELDRIAQNRGFRPVDRSTEPARVQDQLAKLFRMIRTEYGNDLSVYKQSTIDRRIERRMVLHKLNRLQDYVRLVERNRSELLALHKDMLITVTSFFRDPAAHEALKKDVFPRLFEHKEPGEPIRVWVPACATGEEAYSIAIALLEYCDEHNLEERIQIYGTDIDEDAIQTARRGVYPGDIALDVSQERLNRFFLKRDDSYLVTRRIRDLLVFSRQNILKDAPFSRMGLVSCRNLLIYLQPPAQKRVMRVLHYALNPTGYLLLGASESVADSADLFSPLDRKNKIYVKRPVAAQLSAEFAFGAPPLGEPLRGTPAVRPTMNLQGQADRKVLELYGPAGVVVNQDLEVLQFRGRTGPYLDPAPGTASFNLLKIARYELHIELKKAMTEATAKLARVSSEITYREEGGTRLLKLDVVPLQDPVSKGLCFLVLFVPLPPPKEIRVSSREKGAGVALLPEQQRVQALERELSSAKEYLQTTIEEKESALEELQSTNEELQSSNEELQSTNEELETSKEEMQSTLEELTTVNEELHNRMVELSQTNDDLHNVLAGVDHAILIVGIDLKLRRFTVAAERLFHLVPGDVGRAVAFIEPFLGLGGLLESRAFGVIQSLSVFEQEILAANKRWYLFRISPYKTLDHAIRGALLTFIDIDVRKRAEEMTRDVGTYAEKFLAAINHPLLIIDRKFRVVWANAPFYSAFQLSADETLGSSLAGIGAKQFAQPGLRDRLDGVFSAASFFRDYEAPVLQPDGSRVRMRFGGSLVPASPDTPLALLSIEPVIGERESAQNRA